MLHATVTTVTHCVTTVSIDYVCEQTYEYNTPRLITRIGDIVATCATLRQVIKLCFTASAFHILNSLETHSFILQKNVG